MKRKILAAILLAAVCALVSPSTASAGWSVSVSYFQQELTPHGHWAVSANYGDVWVPRGVAASWAPYTVGEWAYTDYGWTWVSYDPWGDIPYHYGTWVWLSPYGWVWVPGTVWAPAWVTWAWTNDYIGWAPVPYSFGISWTGYFGAAVVVPRSHYCFVPVNRFVGVNVTNVRVSPSQNTVIFTRAQKATRFAVERGVVRNTALSTTRIERAVGHSIHRASVSEDKLRPVALTTAASGKSRRVAVVAPARERAAIRTSRSLERQAAPATRIEAAPSKRKAARETVSREAAPRSASSGDRARAVKSRPAPAPVSQPVARPSKRYEPQPKRAVRPQVKRPPEPQAIRPAKAPRRDASVSRPPSQPDRSSRASNREKPKPVAKKKPAPAERPTGR